MTEPYLQSIRKFGNTLLDTVFPPRCISTGLPVGKNGMISPELWGALDFLAGAMCPRCGFPFAFENEFEDPFSNEYICAHCIESPPNFSRARSALKYNEASRALILSFKHGDRLHAVPVFTPWLLNAGKELFEGCDIIVPVPLHPSRLLKRRYNQSALLAQGLHKKTNIQLDLLSLERKRATLSQGHMNAPRRQKNVQGAFLVREKNKPKLRGKTILLIDDVYTSGATIKECSKTLLKAGALDVRALTLARVIKG
jgi:ComF family protein